MKPYVVTQKELDTLDTNLSAMDDDMATALDNIGFYLFTADIPKEDWPAGAEESDVAALIENPVKSISFGVRQMDEILSGLGGRIVFAFYRLQLAQAIAAEPGSEASLFSTVIKSLKDWLLVNIAAASVANHSPVFMHFHKLVTENATKLIHALEDNQLTWAKTWELCDKYGIDFDAVMNKEPVATHALEIAGVKDMPVENLAQFIFLASMERDANQDAVAVAKARLDEAQKAAAENDGGTVLATGGHVTGQFKPDFALQAEEESIRA